MNRPATIYARAVAPVPMGRPAQPWRFDPTRVHGRWTRALRICAATPSTVGEINRAIRKFGHGRNANTERERTRRAVSNLFRLGLITQVEGAYRATDAGLRALAEVREAA